MELCRERGQFIQLHKNITLEKYMPLVFVFSNGTDAPLTRSPLFARSNNREKGTETKRLVKYINNLFVVTNVATARGF